MKILRVVVLAAVVGFGFLATGFCIEATGISAINSPSAPASNALFSQAIYVQTAVDSTLYISGMLPYRDLTSYDDANIIQEAGPATAQILAYIDHVLMAADMNCANVVDVMILLRDIKDMPAVNEAYAAYFSAATHKPARATFQVAVLPKNAPVEIKVTARKVLA